MAIKREKVVRTAERYVAKGKLEAAIKEYRKVLAENPNDANTLNRVGDLYARTNRREEAVKLFSQIAEQYARDGFHVKAIAIYKKIIKLDPTALQVYERLAELYHRQGLLNEARTQYQVLADYYQKHKNAASAITILQRMTEIEPENPSLHLRLAELYHTQQLDEKALGEYRQLADLMLVNGSVDEATKVYLKALEVSSDDLDFVRQAVSGLHAGGHVSAAAQVLAKAAELNPEARAIAREVGLSVGEPEPEPEVEAEAEFTAARELTPAEVIAPAAEVVAPAPEAVEEEPSFDSEEFTFEIGDLEAEEAMPVATAEAAAAAATASEDTALTDLAGPEAEAEDDAFDGTIFTFDLDDEEMPATQVVPPADMVESGVRDSEELEIDLEWSEAEGVAAEDLAAVADAAEEAVAAGRGSPDSRVEIDWSMEAMEELGVEAEGRQKEPVAARDEPTGELGIEIELEAPAAEEGEETDVVALEDEPEPASAVAVRPEEDLLAEARVFAKYGLHEKAQDRLHELLSMRPRHLAGLQLLAKIDLDAGRHDEALRRANEVSDLAHESGDLGPWHQLRDTLIAAGFSLDHDQVTSEPEARADEGDRISQLLDELDDTAFTPPPRPAARAEPPTPVTPPPAAPPSPPAPPSPAPVAAPSEPAVEPFRVLSELEPAEAAPAAEARPPAAREETGPRHLISLGDLGLDDLDNLDDISVPVTGPAVAEPAPPAAEEPDETGMSWLDDVDADDTAVTQRTEAIFDEEDDFFDLAAELAEELDAEEAERAEPAPEEPPEQSLQEIIDGFKQGVSEHLSAGDYDTHFNLGIAYREMGLMDEAIGEFQLAAKDPRYMVECSSMLGLCFLEKGLPELAIKWYRRGLETPSIVEDQTLGLLYDMGSAYLNLGDAEAAYRTFLEVYGINSNYRDVAARLEELRQPS